MTERLAVRKPGRPRAKGAPLHEQPAADRQRLLTELLDELSSHSPADVIRYMRRWPSGPLSLVHLHVLTVLEADGSVPMGALAESLDVSQASATGIVDRMEQRGLVVRQRTRTTDASSGSSSPSTAAAARRHRRPAARAPGGAPRAS